MMVMVAMIDDSYDDKIDYDDNDYCYDKWWWILPKHTPPSDQ